MKVLFRQKITVIYYMVGYRLIQKELALSQNREELQNQKLNGLK